MTLRACIGPEVASAPLVDRTGSLRAWSLQAMALVVLFATQAAAGGPTGLPSAGEEAARSYFTDLELVDQDGRTYRFYSDLLRGNVVLISFGFTACKGACPPITAKLARVQKLLGERVGKDVRILTLTVDPVADTPPMLKRYADKVGAGPGWLFLTGAPNNVSAVLRKLGDRSGQPEQHSTAIIIGDASAGSWLKLPSLEAADRIAWAVEHINDPPRR
ncbi:MAG: SCO family protein [Myxococcales bacterium]|nr:SCO family protein [Myxococcales bacterium]